VPLVDYAPYIINTPRVKCLEKMEKKRRKKFQKYMCEYFGAFHLVFICTKGRHWDNLVMRKLAMHKARLPNRRQLQLFFGSRGAQ